jgi:hypothetical protein
MRKKLQWPVYVFLILPLAGCHLIDMNDILHHPDKIPQLCDIKKMTYIAPGFTTVPQVTTLFYYNKWGNPDSVISDYSATGHPSRYYFRYDHQRRLVWYLSAFDVENGNYWSWSRYQYDHKNRIISDSTYSFGSIVNGQPQYPSETHFRYKTTYTYDARDRVTQAVYNYGNGATVVRGFVYDSQGNRQDAGSSTPIVYDNKANLHRTNKVWMFMMLNYSMNNATSGYPPSLPTSYNHYGLPLNLPEYTTFLDLSVGKNAVITYKCK